MDLLAILGVLISALGIVVTVIYGWGPFFDRFRPSQPSEEEGKRSENTLLKEIQERGSIKVGYFRYPPMIDLPDNLDSTTPVGIYPQLMQKIASANSIKVGYSQLHISECTSAVVAGDVDIVLCIFQTPKRYQEVDFGALLHLVVVTGVVRESECRIDTPAALLRDDVKIVVQKGETGAEFLEQLGVKLGRSRVIQIESDDIAEIVGMVCVGTADVALLDGISIRRFLSQHPEAKLKPAFPLLPLAICPNGIMLSKGEPALREWLTKEFRAAREEPSIRAVDEAILSQYEGILEKLG